ncbi:MAG TPA: metalloregulator ArsR/SmtB family transcription factor [Acidimicrobiia bacterium]
MESGCCTAEALPQDRAEELADTFKVLSDPVRLRLLSLIAASPEVCACDLTDPVERSQATVSHHLSLLVRAGLVVREQRGKWAWFSVAPGREDFVRSVLAGQPALSGR